MKREKVSEQTKIELVLDYKNGLFLKQLCQKYKLGHRKVKKILFDKNIEIRPLNYKRKDLSGQKFNLLTVLQISHIDNWRATHWLCQCDCGQKIIVNNRDIQNGHTKSCGCLSYLKGVKGNKHYRWNSELTLEQKRLGRNCDEYREWRKNVFRRDRWLCQLSNSRKRGICAHHLDGWDNNKEKRYDVNNGITLSKPIHLLFHSLYGLGNNTKDQFIEFSERYKKGEFDSKLNLNSKA